MLTSEKPKKRFFVLSVAVFSTNCVFEIRALALLREIVFLLA